MAKRKKKVQKDKQQSTKHTHKTKVTRIPLTVIVIVLGLVKSSTDQQ